MKESMITDMGNFFTTGIGVTIGDGVEDSSSRRLLENTRVVVSDKTNEINGATYKGKKILILKGGRMSYSKSNNATFKAYNGEFKELLKRAHEEYEKTPTAKIDKIAGVKVTSETARGIQSEAADGVRSEIEGLIERVGSSVEITENELREIRGSLDPSGITLNDKLKALEIESKNWKDKAETESDPKKKALYETISDIVELKSDEQRLREGESPVTDKGISILENDVEKSDLTRFERFKKWARNNLTYLASISITVAGIITTVVMAARGALNKGGDALDKFTKALVKKIKQLAKKLGENIGPIVSAVGSIITGILQILAKGLGFLAEHLWILVLAITYFIYNAYKSRREYRSRRR